ncbi:MAG: right-handed parallel beta-helix repeat-containing protein [Planctomycetota bacterium]
MARRVGAAAFVLATVVAQEPHVLTGSTVLEAGKVYGPLVIGADDVELVGNGAIVRGGDGERLGIGIRIGKHRGVTLRGLVVQGFRLGIAAEDCAGLRLEDCDVGDNFTAPDAGWGELPPGGGIRLLRCTDAAVTRCRGQRNWNGCELVDCARVAVSRCDFAHCSNTGLKLWHTAASRFTDNDFSFGLRIAPGEVHARDSACVLLESGSDGNRFARNDCTYGGDGIFVRVLNQWTSVDNEFVANDASFAHNNAIEAWSPRNSWIGNKANHSSHGFWLGGSDKAVLRGNEAGWNGREDGNHNAPTPFGHCGIVFYGGSASHCLLDDNWCHDNAGPGIAIVGDAAPERAAFRPFHLVVQRNRLEWNDYGLRVEQVDWLDLAGNTLRDNRRGGLFDGGGVTGLLNRAELVTGAVEPIAAIRPVPVLRPGATFAFDARPSISPEGRQLAYRWKFEDGVLASGPRVEHAFATAGSYRVGLTVDDGALFALAWVDVHVVDDGDLAADPSQWTWTDDSGRCRAAFTADRDRKLAGADAVLARVDPYDGMRVNLLWPASRRAALPLAGRSEFVFWLAAIDADPTGWQDGNPVVTLWQDAEHRAVYRPARDLLQLPARSEARDGWTRFAVPLAGDGLWRREGPALDRVEWITLGFDSWGAPPLAFWIDALALR